MNGMKKWQRIKKKIYKHMGILPSILIILILFWSGIIKSFGYIFDIRLLKKVVFKGDFFKSLIYTLNISFSSIFLVGVLSIIGIYILYLLSTEVDKKKLRVIKVFIISPMYIPYLLGGYMIASIISPSGIISSISYKLGLINQMSDFPILVNEAHGYSIMATYGWKVTPFIILMVYPTVLKINNEWLEVAKVYGVNRFHFFKQVVIPVIFPMYIGALLIAFTYIFASFEVPYLLGVTYPRTLSVLAYEKYARNSISNRGEVMVINSIVVLLTTTMSLIVFKINKSFRERVELELEK